MKFLNIGQRLCFSKTGPNKLVNPASIYGPGDFTPSGRAIIDFINGHMPGLFDGSNSFVYIDDVGIGHTLAADKGRVGKRYILSGNSITLNEWSGLLSGVVRCYEAPCYPCLFRKLFYLIC